MSKIKILSLFAALAFVFTIASSAEALQVQGDRATVKRITPQELNDAIAKDPTGVVVVDVRTGSSYTNSPVKIKNAMRFDVISGDFEVRYGDIPKDKMVVLYCT